MIHIADFNFANVMRVRPAPVDGCYCVSRLYPHRQRSYWVSQIRKPSLSLPTTYSGRAAGDHLSPHRPSNPNGLFTQTACRRRLKIPPCSQLDNNRLTVNSVVPVNCASSSLDR
jgi:hypothetical protein